MFSDQGFHELNHFCFSGTGFTNNLIPEDLPLQTLPSVLIHQGDPEKKE